MTIFQNIKNAINKLKFRVALLFKGDRYSASQVALAFNIKQKEKEAITLKMHEYPELNHFLLSFLNSAAIGGRIIGDNLTFVIGAEDVGKTHFIESGLSLFRKLKMQNKGQIPQIHRLLPPQSYQNQIRRTVFDNQHFILLSFNFNTNPAMNFHSFINYIQEEMIKQLVRLNLKLSERVLDPQIIKEVLLKQNAQEYLFTYLKDVVYCIINGTDPIFLDQQHTSILTQFNETLIKVQPRSFFQGQLYPTLIDILSKGLKLSPTETAIRLFLSIGKRVEYEHRSQPYSKSWFLTGIESTNILFDLLNFVCGFGALNKQIMTTYFQTGHLPQLSTNWITSGNRVDVAMSLLNLDSLYIWDSRQLWNFLDHIISRTAAAKGLRNHFPIIIELPSSADLQNTNGMGQFQTGNIPFLEVPGYLQHTLLKSGLSKIFAPKILENISFSLGKSPKLWNQALVQLGNGATIDDVISSKASFIQAQGIKAQAKFNRVFTTIQAQPAIYEGTAVSELIQHIRFFQKANGFVVLDRPGFYIDFISRPLFQALCRQGLIYHNYYLPHVDLSKKVTLNKLLNIKNDLLKQNLIDFVRWRVQNKSRFTILGFQIKYKVKYDVESQKYDKFITMRNDFHLAETYFGPGHNYTYKLSKQAVRVNII